MSCGTRSGSRVLFPPDRLDRLVSASLTIIAAVRLIATVYADAGDEVPFTLGATPLVSRIVAGAACIAGIGLVVLIQPLLAVATAGAGTLR